MSEREGWRSEARGVRSEIRFYSCPIREAVLSPTLPPLIQKNGLTSAFLQDSDGSSWKFSNFSVRRVKGMKNAFGAKRNRNRLQCLQWRRHIFQLTCLKNGTTVCYFVLYYSTLIRISPMTNVSSPWNSQPGGAIHVANEKEGEKNLYHHSVITMGSNIN